MKIVKNLFLVSLLILFAMPLYGAKRLTYYCSTDIPWCELMKKEFEKRTGIRVSMTRASSGETLTKIRAEKSNPKGDVWWGGTGDPHLQAWRCGSPVPPHQTSPLGFDFSARIFVKVSPELARVMLTRMPVRFSNSFFINSHHGISVLQ